eukprot:SAG11_NODE_173_length_13507_cov_10.489931_3_plen_80_part_00
MLFFALNVWQKPYDKMIGLPFYYRFSHSGAPQPAACKILGNFFLEIFVCTRFSGVAIRYSPDQAIPYRYSEVVKPTVGT